MSDVVFLDRTRCGLEPPNLAHLSRRTDPLVGVTVHWTDTALPNVHDVGRQVYARAALAAWQQIQREYMSGNNVNHEVYGDTPYNAAFDDTGRILAGRGNFFVGAHALVNNPNPAIDNAANRFTLGLAYLGAGEPTRLALEAMDAYLYLAHYEVGHGILVLGHQEWAPFGGISTACPGSIEQPVRDVRAKLAA
jgi:hypothetical protein